jgi:hypothetical protein
MNFKMAPQNSEPRFAERSTAGLRSEEMLFGYKWHRDRTKSLIRHAADSMLEMLAEATPFPR